jgi:hypothetical protein
VPGHLYWVEPDSVAGHWADNATTTTTTETSEPVPATVPLIRAATPPPSSATPRKLPGGASASVVNSLTLVDFIGVLPQSFYLLI